MEANKVKTSNYVGKHKGFKPNEISPKANFIISFILTAMTLIYLVPVILVIMVSFSTPESLTYKGYSLFPTELTLSTYKFLLKSGKQIADSYKVTITRTILGTVLSLSVMSLYSYVVAYRAFPARKFYTYYLFVSSIFSGGLVASYIINVRYLGLYDNFWIYILPGLVSWFNIIILRTFIQTTIPDSLFEAAKIDGAGDFTIFFRIVLPLFKAGLATIGLFCVVGHWNEWSTALLYIENPKLVPVQTMLQRIQQNINFLKNNSQMSQTQEEMLILKNLPTESTQMAITVIATVPILCVYPFFQKYFIKGMTIGSVKG
ncbi:MAG: carbohydrate ABC transporter permease [Clostridiales bacterium]|jgi:putative aldouronate transport system permease protein|nr:carbohydrate ABC transporter permease [Clostridiales bacterium]